MIKRWLLVLILLIVGCSKPGIPDPEAAILLAPDNLAPCTTAFIVDANQSRITFRWQQALHTDTYELVIRNISSSQQSKEMTSLTSLNKILDRGAAYEWLVVSLSEASLVESQSEQWQFYVEGNSIVQHLPFATQLVVPANEASVEPGIVVFEWEGNDLDNDPLNFTLYLGTSTTNLLPLIENTVETTFSYSLETGRYFWKVVTFDTEGNSSSSVPFMLNVAD